MEEIKEKNVPAFGYELIRDHLLSSLLGKHEQEVLYWSGKDLARKFPCHSTEEIEAFFQQAGWGNLTLQKYSKNEAVYHLNETLLSESRSNRCFKLEAGFLAEQLEMMNGRMTECADDITSVAIVFTAKSE
ncbi:YslB family protein [Chryseomicrobium palamuruense]|uniref:YslB family protein n=1 Tax=Chryseomicrobium palamuruense TaxID=682973 RepID=A0ABV8UY57_9BACL